MALLAPSSKLFGRKGREFKTKVSDLLSVGTHAVRGVRGGGARALPEQRPALRIYVPNAALRKGVPSIV